jgi:hypothetical protein
MAISDIRPDINAGPIFLNFKPVNVLALRVSFEVVF